ncbi:hypothetical protein BVC80_1721g24 [Macleaya cordata]|uniref:Uncharacterized protein n=1 Tax=Macleaya cordata TaxID=56857 RepID=A0A200QCJ5_MACCD|nr:hypothetical protein BVC80_1721g24 [Macleaya cordata]
MGFLLGAVRSAPVSLGSFAHFRRGSSLCKSPVIAFPRSGLSPIRRIFQASLHSSRLQ